jgi:hypothetical protein
MPSTAVAWRRRFHGHTRDPFEGAKREEGVIYPSRFA